MRSRFSASQHRRGMTLVELLLSLAVTGVIGATVATLLFAVSRGTSSSNDLRESLVRQQILDHRLNAALGASRAVLATGADYLVLWHADARTDGKPNISELRRIERDATGRIVVYRGTLPSDWTPEQQSTADTAYELDANFAAVTASLKGNALFPSEIWATGVSAMSVTLDDDSMDEVALLSYRMTLDSAAGSQVFIGAAALHNNATTSGSGVGGD